MEFMKENDKKLVSFTNLKLINNLVKEEAQLKGISESAVIELCIRKTLLPASKQIGYLIENDLYENDGVRKVLEKLYAWNAAGINGQSVHDNLLPTVKFVYNKVCLNMIYISVIGDERYHLVSQLKSLKQYITESEFNKIDEIIEKLDNAQIPISEILALFFDNWDQIKGLSFTYRALMDIMKTPEIPDDVESKSELRKILCEISSEW